MTPDDQIDHGGDEPQANGSPAPLLEKATATIYLDGLIYAAYNEGSKVLESAILTKAEGHELVIEVKVRGEEAVIWPEKPEDWDRDHCKVAERAPFWLYVDSGKHIYEEEFSATLHSDDDERSFNRIFDFDDFHHRRLRVKPGTFALFNFPHGKSYSADTKPADVKVIPPRGTVADAKLEEEGVPISNLAGIDIDAVSNNGETKWIVLANQNGKHEFFRFPLVADKQYEINIENRPVPNSTTHDPAKHFLQFYELFDLNHDKESQFLVVDPTHVHGSNNQPAEGGELHAGPPTTDNPPCAIGRSGGTGGLSGGGGG